MDRSFGRTHRVFSFFSPRTLHVLVVDALELNVTAKPSARALAAWYLEHRAYKINVAFAGIKPGKPRSPYA